jgi:hypothetical protein
MIRNFSFWRDTDYVPGVTYKIFSTTTTVNAAVISNGGAEVSYTYTSVSAGGGTEVFYNTGPVGLAGSSLQVTACLPSDATGFTLIPNPVDGDSPGTPTSTGTDC